VVQGQFHEPRERNRAAFPHLAADDFLQLRHIKSGSFLIA
jgi:hypothetical protein